MALPLAPGRAGRAGGVRRGAPEVPYESPEHPNLFILSYAKERQMPKGRPTTDPKTDVIRVRLNDEMNQWILRASESRGITVSQLVRELIECGMKADSSASGWKHD